MALDRKKLLIVEDAPELPGILKLALKGEEIDIYSASDGFEAVRMVREIMPDIILLDIMLPKQDGLQVCRLLKFDAEFRHIPIIVMTSLRGDDVEEMSAAAGADYFVAKPFDLTELTTRIKEIASRERF